MTPGPLHDPEDAYAHLRSLLDGASQGILTVSAAGRILLANCRAEEMFGYSPGELPGQDLDVLLPEAYSRTHRASVAAYFAQPRVRVMGAGPDLTARRKDGSGFPAEIGLSFVPSRTGVVAMAIVSDISERVRARELLERANQDLLRSNADLEQFASLVSHDLREPLRTVAGYLQLLEKRYAGSLDAEALEWIRNAVDGSERMAGMIREFLELSSVGTRPLNRVHVASADIVRAALHNLQAAIGETRAEIETGALPGIIADPALLAMTFQNLFANALKFRGASMPRVQIGAVKRELDWMFWVRDTASVSRRTMPAGSSGCSSGSAPTIFPATAPVSPSRKRSSSATADASGPNPSPARAPRSFSPFRSKLSRPPSHTSSPMSRQPQAAVTPPHRDCVPQGSTTASCAWRLVTSRKRMHGGLQESHILADEPPAAGCGHPHANAIACPKLTLDGSWHARKLRLAPRQNPSRF